MYSTKTAPEALLDIDDVPSRSSADDPCLAEVKAVLAKHGCLQRFGIMLLHSHFPVAEDEVLMEECDVAARTLTIRPTKRILLEDVGVKETQWRLDTDSALTGCTQICTYNQGNGGHASTSHLRG